MKKSLLIGSILVTNLLLSQQATYTMTSDVPISMTSIGTDTYNNTIFYHNLDKGLTIDLAKKTNDIAATPIDFNINARGGLNPFLTIKGNTGDMGIGTNDPQHKLDVVGNAQFQDIISGGTNAWMFHTPDDGRKTLYIAYRSPQGWDWGKSFLINGESGDAAIQGKLEAKEVKVTSTPTADFVFADDYKLPKLEDVEKHIKERKHLPEIASAKQMEKEGVNIGEFQIKLLQKIEELTLYSIEQNKQLQEDRKNLKSQSEEIKELKKLVQQFLSTK